MSASRRRSDRYDPRPVLTEPEPVQTSGQVPLTPMATPLGSVFRLTAHCGTCRGVNGQHYPSCRAPTTPRLCRACQSPIAASSFAMYCEPCRRTRCPECQRYAGAHGARCRYTSRRRVRLTEHRGLVTTEDILGLYIECRPAALRLARGIVGPDAEDILHSVTAELLDKRDYLTRVPTPPYFMVAVRNAALRWKQYYWARYSVAMDSLDLLLAEQAQEGARRGRASKTKVRFPAEESVLLDGC